MRLACLLLALAMPCLLACDSAKSEPEKQPATGLLAKINLPEGFEISYYAEGVAGARSICWGSGGTLFVGSRSTDGAVVALVDTNQDFVADKRYTIAAGLNMPNGVAFKDGDLYIAEVDKIWRYDNIESSLANPPAPVLVTDKYPDETHHGWKYIAFGPDGKLYVPVGAPCNICENADQPIFASMTRINADGTGREVFASGIRNSVGFAWHPTTGELWFTDNGRDLMGDNVPPCELNHAPTAGLHFGYPYCHGGTIADPEFGAGHPCAGYRAPAQNLGPHVAPLGMKFYTGSQFPESYRNQIIIAEHGSWNRSEKIGYRLSLVTLSGSTATGYTTFADGWLERTGSEETVHGRPVDVLQAADGSLLVSDDYANCIYRIRYVVS